MDPRLNNSARVYVLLLVGTELWLFADYLMLELGPYFLGFKWHSTYLLIYIAQVLSRTLFYRILGFGSAMVQKRSKVHSCLVYVTSE